MAGQNAKGTKDVRARVTAWVFLLIVSSALYAAPGYYRPAWPSSGCQDLRTEILVERGQAVLDSEGCVVLGGIFPDDYSRTAFIAFSWRDVAIEHLDPARRLWDLLCDKLGGPPDPDTWERVYTDPTNLWITDRITNSRKGPKGPHEWCPEAPAARRRAAASIRRLRYRYQLSTSPEEEQGLRAWEQGRCMEDTEAGR